MLFIERVEGRFRVCNRLFALFVSLPVLDLILGLDLLMLGRQKFRDIFIDQVGQFLNVSFIRNFSIILLDRLRVDSHEVRSAQL